MTAPKPSDLAYRTLHAVRKNTSRIAPEVEQARAEIDYLMSDYLGPDWRDQLDVEDAAIITDITLNHTMEDN